MGPEWHANKNGDHNIDAHHNVSRLHNRQASITGRIAMHG
jgi:hypothetical protein